MRRKETIEQRFTGWWSWADDARLLNLQRFLPHPHAYAGEARRRKGESQVTLHLKGVGLSADELLNIRSLDASSFLVSFPQNPWAKDRVIVFRLPWDEREPVKAFFYGIKRRLTEYLQERSIRTLSRKAVEVEKATDRREKQ